MKIAIIGAGYVGLVTGACLAEFGFEVTCIDRDIKRIEALERGEMPIYEPGLDTIVANNRRAGRLRFVSELKPAVAEADVVFIAVGTPSRRGDDAADLAYVFGAAEDIASALDGYTVVVTKSTVPVGTARKIRDIIRAKRPDADFDVASNPEFLREGSAVDDFLMPDRIVIGIDNDRPREHLRRVYRPITVSGVPIVFTGFESAELIKYAANGYLAMRLAFINELSDLCEAVGADLPIVARAVGQDKRIGQHYLQPGPGFGGSCFPKDTRALAATAREAGRPMTMMEAVNKANVFRKESLARRVIAAMGGTAQGKRIAVLGIAFKADTDDVRESPALDIIPALQAAGATVAAYDPIARRSGEAAIKDVTWCKDAYEAARWADALVILTEWKEFRGLDLDRIASSMRNPLLIDFRNLYSPFDMAKTPFVYHSLGRPIVEGQAAR
jgi:UDPglucose 6-dehydrogenase